MEKANNKALISIGLICYLLSTVPYFYYDILGYTENSLIIKLFIAPMMWTICMSILILKYKMVLSKLWWILFSAPFVFWPIITTLFTFIVWEFLGFAP